MSAIETVGRVGVREALPALGALCIFLFARGLMMLLDQFCRALFGTVDGAVGWVPFAGKVAKRNIHKIEQKVSSYIGGAERGIDAHIAASFHKLAAFVRSIPSLLVDEAGLLFGLAAALVILPSVALVKYLIRVATHPLRAKDALLGREQAATKAQTKTVTHSVAHGVYPRLKVGEAERAHVIQPGLTTAREQAKAAERTAIDTYKYLTKHRTSLLTGVFTGAVAWALARVGGGWIRCHNWRKLGKAVCRMPSPIIDAMIAALLAEVLFSHLDTLLEFVGDAMDEVTRDLYRAFGLGDLPNGHFTVE